MILTDREVLARMRRSMNGMRPEAIEAITTPYFVSLRRRYEHICERLAHDYGLHEGGIKLIKRWRNIALSDIVTAEGQALAPWLPIS